MSSITRSVSQLPTRVKYLLVINSAGGNDCAVYTPTSSLNSIESQTSFAAKTTIAFRPYKTLFRDMGDAVTTINDNGQHIGLFRSVQRVAGISSEGVPADFDIETVYVQVWSADPTVQINVVRVG